MKKRFQSRFFRNSKTYLASGVLLAALPFVFGGCPISSDSSADDLVMIELNWDQDADLDIHLWQTPSTQCSNTECTLPNMSITDDVTAGKGPEIITLKNSIADGRYRVAANFHEVLPPALHGNRTATIKFWVKEAGTWNSTTYGPYTFTVEIGSGGFPVTGNTESWWRPFDFQVSGGVITVLAADSTPLTK